MAAPRRAVQAIALFEAFKGAVVLVAATGVAALVHKDLLCWPSVWSRTRT